MNVQNIDRADSLITTHFQNRNASVSAIYRKLRKHEAFSSFGDYPILSQIVHVMKDMGMKISKTRVQRAFRTSTELKGNTNILTQLLNA